jgi:hypothetical protein
MGRKPHGRRGCVRADAAGTPNEGRALRAPGDAEKAEIGVVRRSHGGPGHGSPEEARGPWGPQ